MSPTSRTTIVAFPLIVLAIAVAGCGGGGSSSSGGDGGGGGGDQRPSGGKGVNGISLGNCLIDENWLVQPSQTELDGQTEDGSNVHIVIYKDAAEATKKATGVKGAVPVENVVITFIGNKSPYAPGKTLPKANQKAVDTIETCVKQVAAS
jgi:hypothetical protein